MQEVIGLFSAAFAYFIISFVWNIYFKIHDRPFHKLKERGPIDPAPYLVAVISSIWVSYGLFILTKHVKPQGTDEAIFVAIGAWAFLCMAPVLKNQVIKGSPVKDVFINLGGDLFGFVAAVLLLA